MTMNLLLIIFVRKIEVTTMEWNPDALKELEKVPEHVRSMAKMGIETAVEKKGKNIVSIEDVNEAALQFRAIMGKGEKDSKNNKDCSRQVRYC